MNKKLINLIYISRMVLFVIGVFVVSGLLSNIDSVKAYQSCGCDPRDGSRENCVDLGCPAGYTGTKTECDNLVCCRECNLIPDPLGGLKTVCGSCSCSVHSRTVLDRCVKCPTTNSCQSNTCIGSTCTDLNGCVYNGTKNCSTTAVNGRCSTTATNGCLAGTFSDVADSNMQYLWKCVGINGGTTANCSKDIPTGPSIINGLCGTTNNSCIAGSWSDITDTSTNYLWTCKGSNGGYSQTCVLPKTTGTPGVCGSIVDTCSSGTYVSGSDTSTYDRWGCRGTDGILVSCQLAKPCVPSWRCDSTGSDAWTGWADDLNGCSARTNNPSIYAPLDCTNNNVTGDISGIGGCGDVTVTIDDPDISASRERTLKRQVYLQITPPTGPMFPTKAQSLVSGDKYVFDARDKDYYKGEGTYLVDLVIEDVNPNESKNGYDVIRNNAWTYFIQDPTKCDSCTTMYNVEFEKVSIPLNNENDLGFYSVVNNILDINLRLKTFVGDYGGVGNLDIVVNDVKVERDINNKCNACITTYPTKSYTFPLNQKCPIPDTIVLDPNSIDFDYSMDGNSPTGFDTSDAVVGCSLTNEVVDITTSTVIVDEGELDACFNVSFLSNNFPYKRYQIENELLASRCDGVVNFDIEDYVYGGENWGPLNGVLDLVYQPSEERVSERFEYSGDVIVNPPPGFEQFYLPSQE